MDSNVFWGCFFIVGARMVDVSLGTLRTVLIVRGRKNIAFVIGFLEVLIWITVISSVVQKTSNPVYAVSYAFGYALGTYVGLTIETWVSMGEQVVRIFTRKAEALAPELRFRNFGVTEFSGVGRDGPVHMLFLQCARRQVGRVIEFVTSQDPDAFYIVDDVRMSAGLRPRWHQPAGWRAIFKRK